MVHAKGKGWLSHLVHLSDLPGPLGRPSVGEERLRFVKDQEQLLLACLLKRGRDPLLRLTDPFGHQIGGAFLHEFESHPLGEVARVRTLPRTGRTLQAQRTPVLPPVGEAFGQLLQVSVRVYEVDVIECGFRLGRPLGVEQPGQTRNTLAHGVYDIASR